MHLSVEGLRPWDWSYPVLQYIRQWPTPTVVSSLSPVLSLNPNNQPYYQLLWFNRKPPCISSIVVIQQKNPMHIIHCYDSTGKPPYYPLLWFNRKPHIIHCCDKQETPILTIVVIQLHVSVLVGSAFRPIRRRRTLLEVSQRGGHSKQTHAVEIPGVIVVVFWKTRTEVKSRRQTNVACKKKTSLYHVISSFILGPSGACASSHEISSIWSHILNRYFISYWFPWIARKNFNPRVYYRCLLSQFHYTSEFFLTTLLAQIHRRKRKQILFRTLEPNSRKLMINLS